jgi:hypothetical protein
MKAKTVIGIIISFMAIQSFAQNEQKKEEHLPKFSNAGWPYSKIDKTYIEYEKFDTLFSPFGEFEILTRSVGLSDCVMKSQYFIINSELNDTSELLTILGHDGPPVNFFWTPENKLIYEYCEDYRQNTELKILDLKKNEIVFSTPGAIPVIPQESHKFFDRKNNILIYYIPGTEKKNYFADLMKLDLNDLSLEKLMTFTSKFSYEYPVVTLDTNNRHLTVEYLDLNTWKRILNELQY